MSIFSALWATILFVLIIVATFKFFQSYKYDMKTNELNNGDTAMSKSSITIAIILVASGIAVISDTLSVFISCSLKIPVFAPVFNGIFILNYVINLLCAILMFILRLYEVFQGTIYAYNPKVLIGLIVATGVSVLLAIIGVIFAILEMWFICYIVTDIGLLIYITVSAVTVYLFVYGLHTVKYCIQHNYTVARKFNF